MHHRNKHRSPKFATISSIWTKIYRYFGLAGDISTFNRTFYSILYADRNGRGFQLGNRPSCAISVNIYTILQIITRYFGTFWEISTFGSTFYSILTQNAMHTICSAETCPATRNSPTFTRFLQKIIVISLLLELFRRLNVHFTPFLTQNVVHSICSAETSPADRKYESI